jgi:hypothetical protein
MRLEVLSIALVACMAGTETDVIVTTDAPCTSISNAIVSLSGAQTYLTCSAGDFGIAVYHPDATATEVTVVATVDGSDPSSCFGSTPSAGCIIARRHAPVAYQTNVPVVLEQACAGLACTPSETCMHGVCVSY